jgi:hypothetical protein
MRAPCHLLTAILDSAPRTAIHTRRAVPHAVITISVRAHSLVRVPTVVICRPAAAFVFSPHARASSMQHVRLPAADMRLVRFTTERVSCSMQRTAFLICVRRTTQSAAAV